MNGNSGERAEVGKVESGTACSCCLVELEVQKGYFKDPRPVDSRHANDAHPREILGYADFGG